MSVILRKIALLALVPLVLALVIACGDDDDDDAPTATEAATRAAATQPASAEPTATRDAPSSADEPQSYHFEVAVELTIQGEGDEPDIQGTVVGDFVAPDRHYVENTFSLGGLSGVNETIVIGNEAWYREGNEEWRSTSLSDPDVTSALALSSADPDGFLAADQQFIDDISALRGEPEERNGIATLRYEVAREDFALLTDLLGDDFLEENALEGIDELEMTVWIAEDFDFVVAAEVIVVASAEALADDAGFAPGVDGPVRIRVAFDISRIGDTSLSVEPPV